MKRANFPGRKLERQKAAATRESERAQRSNEQQLARLDKMLGKDVGAVKERLRLSAAE